MACGFQTPGSRYIQSGRSCLHGRQQRSPSGGRWPVFVDAAAPAWPTANAHASPVAMMGWDGMELLGRLGVSIK